MNDGNLSTWSSSVQDGVSDALGKVIVSIPDILAAIVVLLIGVVVGAVLKAVVVRVLSAVKLRSVTDQFRLNQVFTAKVNFVELIGDLVKWFFIIVFLLQALSIAHLEQVNDVISKLLAYVPNVIVAATLVLVGAVVADLTSRFVTDTATTVGASTARLLGDVAKYAIVLVVAFTALAQLGVNTLFLDRLFTAIVVMVGLAGGLAFGLGGRDLAKESLDRVKTSFKK